ncbi:hypothetical protein HY374_00560 [Candidatus Berkelbacteria bacterium]|nr:hypothetical protein [Candidatus Berkelbacteria bacterium]
MPQVMQYGLWGLVGSLVLSAILYFAGIVPVFWATFGLLAIAIVIVVAMHTLGKVHWPITLPLGALGLVFLGVGGFQTYLAYQPRTQDALERQREKIDTSNAAALTPVGLRQRQALLVHCTRLDEAVGARIAAEAALIQVPATKGLGDAIREIGKGLSRLEQRARESSTVIAQCLNEARGKTWWGTLKKSLPDFSQVGTAGGLIALGLLLFGIGFVMSKVKIGPAWIANTLGGLALIAGLVWLFFGADIAKAVVSNDRGPQKELEIRYPPVAQASSTQPGTGLVFLKGLPHFPTPITVQPGQCVRIWIEGAVQPGWEHISLDQRPVLNKIYLDSLRTGRNPILGETTIVVGGSEYRFDATTLDSKPCNDSDQPQYVAFKTNGWGGSGDSLTVQVRPQ